MKPPRYYPLPVLVLGFISSRSAQQNSTNVNVSSVVTCVSTGDHRQHIPDPAAGLGPVALGFSSD
jgi:hypothetical protein